MDLRALQLFQNLASTLHFGKSANVMHVSPSTLSRAIQRLEEECGAALFRRDNRTVELTQAGRIMQGYAAQTLEGWHKLKSEFDQLNPVLKGELRVFCSVTASQSHLPALLDQFRPQHPQVEFKLITGDHGTSFQKLIDQEVDAAIAIKTPDMPAELAFFPIDTVPLLLIAPLEANLSKIEEVDWAAHSVVLPDSGPSKRIVHHWLTEIGIRPRVYATVGGNEAIVSMVALGCGLGIVPKAVLDNSTAAKRVSAIKINNIEPYNIGLSCLKSRVNEPLIVAFIAQGS